MFSWLNGSLRSGASVGALLIACTLPITSVAIDGSTGKLIVEIEDLSTNVDKRVWVYLSGGNAYKGRKELFAKGNIRGSASFEGDGPGRYYFIVVGIREDSYDLQMMEYLLIENVKQSRTSYREP